MSDSRGAAAVGLTVKSGWACAVLVVGNTERPEVADSRTIELSDPAVPRSRQPYHQGFGTARKTGPELTRLVTSVRRFGRRSVLDLMRRYRKDGYELAGTGIVVGSLIDPDSIGNEHIRIHALEGQLFRRVVADASKRSKVAPLIWRERDLYQAGAETLGLPEQMLRAKVTALGTGLRGSWRAEQKAAALAAWLALVGPKARRQAG